MIDHDGNNNLNDGEETEEEIRENEVIIEHDGDNKLGEETVENQEVEIIEYDGDIKSDELGETDVEEVERKPWKSKRVKKRATIMTYDEMGGNPRKTYR